MTKRRCLQTMEGERDSVEGLEAESNRRVGVEGLRKRRAKRKEKRQKTKGKRETTTRRRRMGAWD